jgi:glycosyltransferase involved in cell wall biosynthesis
MKKVAFFIPDLGGAGAERVVSNLTQALAERGYDIFLILYNQGDVAYPFGGKLLIIDSKIDSIFYKNKILKFLYRTYRLKKLKLQYKFDVVISFLENPDFQNILTKGKEKVFISVRNFASKSYSKNKRFISKLLYKRADKIIAVSEELKQDLIKNFFIEAQKIKVIYNPYDIEKINLLAQEAIEGELKDIFNKKCIINTGRLTMQKGQWHLIRAFSYVCNEFDDIELVFMGDGPLLNKLQRLAEELGVIDRVHFIGFQSNPYKYMKNSCLYVLTSLYEGFPNALVEAMICGLPIISVNCKSGPKEILVYSKDDINQNCGVLLEEFQENRDIQCLLLSEKEKKMAIKICELLTDSEEYQAYRVRSLERSEDFRLTTIIEEWRKIL